MQTCRNCKKELSLSSFKLKKDGKYTTGCETCRLKDSIKRKEKVAKSKQQSIPEGSSNCVGCLKILPLENFKVSKAGKPLKNCITCVDKAKKRVEEKEYDPETSKICKRCKRVVLLENFKTYRGKTTLQCNDCIASGVKAREKDKKKFAEMKVEEGHKFCLGCRKVLPLDQYNERTTGGLMAKCRTCNTEQLEYLHQHKCPHGKVNKSACKECGGTSICEHGRTRTYCKECGGGSLCEHEKRKDRCADCAHLYGRHQYCEHGSFKNTCVTCKGGGICEHETRRNRCRYCDFGGFLISRVRSAISGALESNKSKRTLDYLCCDIISYRKYLEDLMVDGMTWENYGSVWDIDHIVPLKYQNPTLEEIIERLHYTNTQPLWKRDNIVKGNKYISWLQQEAP
jgi:hypothetical protein